MESNLPGWATALLAAAGVAVFSLAAWMLLQGAGDKASQDPTPPAATSTPPGQEPTAPPPVTGPAPLAPIVHGVAV